MARDLTGIGAQSMRQASIPTMSTNSANGRTWAAVSRGAIGFILMIYGFSASGLGLNPPARAPSCA